MITPDTEDARGALGLRGFSEVYRGHDAALQFQEFAGWRSWMEFTD